MIFPLIRNFRLNNRIYGTISSFELLKRKEHIIIPYSQRMCDFNKVKEILITKKGVQTLDLSDMTKGIYFGNLIVNDEVISIKKLIVK